MSNAPRAKEPVGARSKLRRRIRTHRRRRRRRRTRTYEHADIFLLGVSGAQARRSAGKTATDCQAASKELTDTATSGRRESGEGRAHVHVYRDAHVHVYVHAHGWMGWRSFTGDRGTKTRRAPDRSSLWWLRVAARRSDVSVNALCPTMWQWLFGGSGARPYIYAGDPPALH